MTQQDDVFLIPLSTLEEAQLRFEFNLAAALRLAHLTMSGVGISEAAEQREVDGQTHMDGGNEKWPQDRLKAARGSASWATMDGLVIHSTSRPSKFKSAF